MLIPMSQLAICPGNCSGNGVCLSGTCLCEVQYSGGSCDHTNIGYFVTFGLFFYLICLGAILQLVLCMWSDFTRSKRNSLHHAFRPSIQKLIYLAVICATGSRAVYFTLGLLDLSKVTFQENLFSTFYPFVLSGMFLIICFWAETFHVSGLKLDRPRFLTKSFVAFVIMNFMVYGMLVMQYVGNHLLNEKLKVKLNEVVNGSFAVLMLISLVFFLIYGVEIFCKVEGAFKPDTLAVQKQVNVNFYQLFVSRFGLVMQAGFLLAVTVFLMSEVLSKMWKEKLPIGERNIFNIAYHVAELAVVLWFPCCLWNVYKPGELWILNPQKILDLERVRKEAEQQAHEQAPIVRASPTPSNYNTFSSEDDNETDDEDEEDCDGNQDCWICYDDEKIEHLIQPCDCKGGTKYVHHTCLKKWLMERPSENEKETISCSVCKAQYNVEKDTSVVWLPSGQKVRAWSQTLIVAVTMILLPVSLFLMWKRIPYDPLKVGMAFALFFGELILAKFLGFNFVNAYSVTKRSALRILSKKETRHSRSNGYSDENNFISSVSVTS